MPGPTARHARHCPSDEGLATSLRYLSPRVGDISPQETQQAGEDYHAARVALWDLLLADERGATLLPFSDTPPRPGSLDDLHFGTLRELDAALVRSAPLVRTDEERAILHRARAHRQRAILGLLGLGAAFARAHRGAGQGGGRGLNLVAPGGEALQGALEHIMYAVDAYDPSRAVKLSTFAAWHAFRGVQLERLRAGPVRLNATALTRWGNLQDVESSLAHQLGRDPTFDEVAAALGSPSKIRTALAAAQALRPVHSMSVARFGDDDKIWDLPDPGADPEETTDARRRAQRAAVVVEAVAPAGSPERVVAEALADGGARAATAAVGRAEATRARSVMRRRAADLR